MSSHLPDNRNREMTDQEHDDANYAAQTLLGRWVRDTEDSEERVWRVTDWDPVGKDGWATISGEDCWARPEAVTVIPDLDRKISDATALDRMMSMLSAPGDWSGADVCEALATVLIETGRPVIYDN